MQNNQQSRIRCLPAVLAAACCVAGALSGAARADTTIGDVFYIALENHDFTQPSTYTGTQAVFGNPAAPYINSLITVGNPNAAQVSYETNYIQPGSGDHPSEPNYVWAEAGTNFNPNLTGALQGTGNVNVAANTNQGIVNGTTILNDNDSSAASGNIFPVSFAANHLTGQLNAAGISWKNYQEDYQITSNTVPTGGSPTVSKSGTSTTVQNPYNGSFQYNYAEKHNPMAFFADTATQNVAQMSQLQTDLTNNSVGRYNWITPNQYNDMHTALTGGFTYNGTHYTGDSAQIAQGDNFLSIVIPEIMASQAYQNNGVIVIWNDETEGGDTSAFTSTEIVISKLAKGNAFASSVATDHSSDILTMEEMFNLPTINNPIPATETLGGVAGQYATVAGSNDLSDLFVAGTITPVPEPASMSVLAVGTVMLLRRRARKA